MDRHGFVSKFGHHSSLSGWNIQSFLQLPLGPCPSHCYIAMEHLLSNISSHVYSVYWYMVLNCWRPFSPFHSCSSSFPSSWIAIHRRNRPALFQATHSTDRRTRWRLIGCFHCDLGKSSNEAQTHRTKHKSLQNHHDWFYFIAIMWLGDSIRSSNWLAPRFKFGIWRPPNRSKMFPTFTTGKQHVNLSENRVSPLSMMFSSSS